MNGREYININMGCLTREQAANIAREMRYIWRYLENVYPNGDRKAAPSLKVTLDSFGQYHFYLNHQAMKLILFYAKDIPGPLAAGKQATQSQLRECPDDVPDFLRWGPRSTEGSTPE